MGNCLGYLTVLRLDHRRKTKSGTALYWLCSCDCGGTNVVMGGNLRNGSVISCGCKWREWLHSDRRRVHGKEPRKLYSMWLNMIQRCENSGNPEWNNYGGRGISVCMEWRSSYVDFRNWATAHDWQPHLEIDRIGVDGNYEPSNCRFVNQVQQARNKRSNRMLTVGGKTKCIAEWADDTGLQCRTIQRRLGLGWSEEDAVRMPLIPDGMSKRNYLKRLEAK